MKRMIYFVHCVLTKLLYYTTLRRRSLKSPYQSVVVPLELIKFRKVGKKINARYLKFKIKKVGLIETIDWNNHKEDINTLKDIKVFKERIIDKKQWEATIYFKAFNNRLKQRKAGRGGTKSWGEYKRFYLTRWDKLIDSIHTHGYLKKEETKVFSFCSYEVEIAIDENGQFIFIDGRHRFSIAKVLNIKSIPVNITSIDSRVFTLLNLEPKKTTPNDLVKRIILMKKV